MSKKYLTFLFLVIAMSGHAQQWAWTDRAGSSNSENPGNDWANSVRTDNVGNVYCLYWFGISTTDPIDAVFDNDTIDVRRDGQAFVAKYDSLGNKLWSRNLIRFIDTISTSYGYFHPLCMEIDSSGFIYIGGTLGVDQMIFGNDTITSANGYVSAFVLKCDTALNPVWFKSSRTLSTQSTSTVYSQTWDLHLDHSGNIYTVGVFQGVTVFGSDTLVQTFPNQLCSFIARYDTAGNHIWARHVASSSSCRMKAISGGNGGNLAVAGYFNNNVSLNSNALNSAGVNGAILLIDSLANFQNWILAPKMEIQDIECRDTGFYVAGHFMGTISLPIGNFSAVTANGFVAKLSGTGNWQWFNHTPTPATSFFKDITVMPTGDVAVIGAFYGPFFNWNSHVFQNEGVMSDVQVHLIDSFGQTRWIATGGSILDDEGRSICSSAEGKLYTCGFIRDPDNRFGTLNINVRAQEDAFIARLIAHPCFGGFSSLTLTNDTTICKTDSLLCTAQSGLSNVHWSNGDTTSTSWVTSEGDISYFALDASGCYYQSDAHYVDTKPDPIIMYNSPPLPCPSQSITPLVNGGPYTSYLWSTGATTSSILINQTGNYWVLVTDTNNCMDTSNIIQVIYSDVHAAFSDSNLCAASGTQFIDSSYSTVQGEFINGWSWDFYPGISTLQNPLHTYANPGTFTVQLRVRSNNNCWDTLIRTITVDTAPQAFIFQTGDTLFSTWPVNNQWYFNNQLLNGATDTMFIALQNGTYYTVAANSCGMDTSNTIILDVGYLDIPAKHSVEYFPNPSSSHIFIRSLELKDDVQTINIYDVTGKLLQSEEITPGQLNNGYRLNFSFSETGVFFIGINNFFLRIVRQE